MSAATDPALHAWRHPKPIGAEGRCIGARTDLPVDARKAKRLAHRIRSVARRDRLPHVVATSPLRRCRDVGRWLRRFGFRCLVDERLLEVDFGRWDGRRWDLLPRDELAAWTDDLANHAPGGGECVQALLSRVDALRRAPPASLLVTHGGWLSAALWWQRREAEVDARRWPQAPRYGARLTWVG